MINSHHCNLRTYSIGANSSLEPAPTDTQRCMFYILSHPVKMEKMSKGVGFKWTDTYEPSYLLGVVHLSWFLLNLKDT